MPMHTIVLPATPVWVVLLNGLSVGGCFVFYLLLLSDMTTALKRNGAMLRRLRTLFAVGILYVAWYAVGLSEEILDFLPGISLNHLLHDYQFVPLVFVFFAQMRFWQSLHKTIPDIRGTE